MSKLKDINLNNRKVLIRVDYNVPIESGVVKHDYRIRKTLKTINYCLKQNASIILISHLGRPYKVDNKLSLKPVYERLKLLINNNIFFSNDCISENSISFSKELQSQQIHMLENLRFHSGEIENSVEFSKKLSEHGEIFINDSFGTMHRNHASNCGIPLFIEKSYPGFLVEDEIKIFNNINSNPIRPFGVILGGAKLKDKIPLINNMIDKADNIIIGGGMAFTFLKATGKNIGKSMLDFDSINIAKNILKKAKNNNVNIVLPIDAVVFNSGSIKIKNIYDFNDNDIGYDIGPETCNLFNKTISLNNTLLWNGPMGKFEKNEYSKGTSYMADLLYNLTKSGTNTIIGGGDTASALDNDKIMDGYSHVSTGGGASLKLMSNDKLTALELLEL